MEQVDQIYYYKLKCSLLVTEIKLKAEKQNFNEGCTRASIIVNQQAAFSVIHHVTGIPDINLLALEFFFYFSTPVYKT